VCYFATDIHSRTLGRGKRDDSLERCGEIKGEVVMVSFLWCSLEDRGTRGLSEKGNEIDLLILCTM
jgi:hypothetical protein